MQEGDLEFEQVLGDRLLRRHVANPRQWQYLMGAARFEQRSAQLEGMRGDHVVVSEAVNQQQRPGQTGGEGGQVADLVRLG